MKGQAKKTVNHDWLSQSKWYDQIRVFDLWKHGNSDDTGAGISCKKLVVDAIKHYGYSRKRDQCRKAQLLSWSSTFRDLVYKAFETEEVETSLVYKAFETVYWIIKEEVANKV